VDFAPPGSSGDYEHVFGGVATLQTTVGDIGVPVSGSANPPAQINITPTTLEFGNVQVGSSGLLGFQINNQGSLPLTITESEPPSSDGFTATSTLSASTVISANSSLFEQVEFQPQSTGTFVGSWLIEGNDGSGLQTVTLTGTGVPVEFSGGGGGGGGAANPPPTVSPPPTYAGIPAATFGSPSSVTTSSGATSTISMSTGEINETISVPSGALPDQTAVSLYPVADPAPLENLLPSGQSYVISFSITWLAPDGTSPTSQTPITAVVEDPAIRAGDVIYELTSNGLVAVGTSTQDGSATVSFTTDPTFLIAQRILATQAPLSITSGPGQVGTPLRLITQGGSGLGAESFVAANGTATGCTIDGQNLNALSAGTCIVIATKAGDSNFKPEQSSAVSLQFVARSQIAPTEIQFAPGKMSLSASSKIQLASLARKLKTGEMVVCTGFAWKNPVLAFKRAAVVANFIVTLKTVRLSLSGVTDSPNNWVTIVVKNS
jgi:hypothetical protein